MLQRYSTSVQGVTIGQNVPGNATLPSQSMRMEDFAGGMVCILPTGASGGTLTWYHSYDNVTWYALQDGSGNAVTSNVSSLSGTVGLAIPIPSQCFGAKFVAAVDLGSSAAYSSNWVFKG